MKWVTRERPKIDRIATAWTLASVVSTSLALTVAAGPAPPLVLEQKIPLGEVRDRIDHLAVDLPRQRLFVAELGNNSLGVVDLAAGKLLRRIGGLDEPQGIAYDPASDTVFVADGGDGSVHRFTGADLTPLDPVQLGADADNVRLDPEAGRVVVGYGDGALALVETASGKPATEIRLPGHPESFSARARRPADLRQRAGRASDHRRRPLRRPAGSELGLGRCAGQFPDGARRG